MVWFEFIICAGLLIFFAHHLCKEGVVISERTGISAGVIGVIFLAIATSFPEIVTAAVAVFSLGRVGLGYGDIAGSIMFNFMVLFLLDIMQGEGRILLKVSRANRITGFFVIFVILVVLGAAGMRVSGAHLAAFKGVGAESVLLIAVYLVCINILRKQGYTGHEDVSQPKSEPFWAVWAKFIMLLVVVMLLGAWLARIGERIVMATGLSQVFTGAVFLGIVTSFPEFIVSFTALRHRSIDMAVGNILGSNLFDICIVPFLDFLTKTPILGVLTRGQIMATGVMLALSVIAVIGLYVTRDTRLRVKWDTGLIFAIGFAGFVLLYFVK